ncbi:hypothetical protein [Nocardia australiensis]|uniref:hypothetical protein n=1 Tax=Nocardia australiensis TaxID=2887191 RepID=UPI001D138E95|nr:hypothetical protein [Nocardia australiensis]
MESSRAKIAGPAIAVGAVSLGLVLIGACGIGKHDTYVAPPPIKSVSDAAPEPVREDTTTKSVVKVPIPPSPSWRVAPDGPRVQVGFTVPETATATAESTSSETTTRPSRTTTPHSTYSPSRPHATTTESDDEALDETPTTTLHADEPADLQNDGE